MYKTETPNWHLNMAERHVEKLSQENEALRDQLHSLFERVSGCEVSEFSSEQVNYLADMIEGQMDANEGCINKLKSENAALREAFKLKELERDTLILSERFRDSLKLLEANESLREALRLKEAESDALAADISRIVSAAADAHLSGSEQQNVDHLYLVIHDSSGKLYNDEPGDGDENQQAY